MTHRVGIDLGGTKIQGVLIDETGRIVDERRLRTPRDDYDACLDVVCALAGSLVVIEHPWVSAPPGPG